MGKRTPAEVRLAQAKYRASNSDKVKARATLRAALKSGRMVAQPCMRCGSPDGEAHHDDYGKPLNVRWYCKACHGERHQAMVFVGVYPVLPDGTPDRIELVGRVEPPPGYEVHRYFPSPTGWTTVVKRVKIATSR